MENVAAEVQQDAIDGESCSYGAIKENLDCFMILRTDLTNSIREVE